MWSTSPIEWRMPESSARCEDLIERLTDLIEGAASELIEWIYKRGDTARIATARVGLDGWGVLVLVRWRHELIERYKEMLKNECNRGNKNGTYILNSHSLSDLPVLK